ncbi:hypothetical protein C900_00413 [Fulvivirga imtechensis AK7]|uniref:Uncharacterized protein n=1 Tax=Fulvivirga imtechensis AK7 TaxID=1237149 RepID=L8JHP5_9BACT|nr:hypothetical protein C900_00413 [Fulvivirga imtechensis AK7]
MQNNVKLPQKPAHGVSVLPKMLTSNVGNISNSKKLTQSTK